MGSCSRATVHPTCIHSLTATRFSGRQKEPLRHLGPQQPDLHPQRCPSPCSPAPQPAQNTNPLLMEQVGGPAGPPVPSVRVLPIGLLPSPRHYNLWRQTFPDHRSPGAQSHLGGHSRAPSQTSWGAALPTAHSRAALAVPTSRGLSSPGKADTGVSHKVGGLSELKWLTQVCPLVCPHCHQLCLTL